MARFEGQPTLVKKASEFNQGLDLLFRVDSMSQLTATQVEVYGGYYEGFLSASGETYLVEYANGRWTVNARKLRWIS